MIKYQVTIFLTFIFFQLTHAGSLNDYPGSVPLTFGRLPSSDLVYNGETITPLQAKQLYLNEHVDLSELNPQDGSDIWSNNIGTRLDPKDDILDFDDTAPGKHVSNIISRIGNFRFTIKQSSASGETKTYTVLASKDVHAFLLRKNLLRKLGYKIPAIKYLKNLDVSFNGSASKKSFISDLESATFGGSKRWVAKNEEGHNNLTLQDVIMFDSNEQTYNLAIGQIPGEIIRGRRVLNALIIPYGIVDTRESINGFKWSVGKTVNNSILFDIMGAETFSTTWHDGIWITKRVAKLSREDFEEIVEQSYYPAPVAALLVEKLISRRNSIINKFKLENISDITINPKISLGQELNEGVLLESDYQGYASKFSYGSPDSPLSSSEIRSFFLSKILSTTLDNLVENFNDKFLLNADIGKAVYEKQKDLINNQIEKFFKTGELNKIPVGIWATPTYNGNVSISRDIVTGSYMGTSNVIQLADSLDLQAGVGVYVGIHGLPANLKIEGGAGVSLSRTYTHLKPIKSIKKALREPFRHILVPMVKDGYGKIFDDLASGEYKDAPDESKDKMLEECVKLFQEKMEIGESLIISDNITFGGSVGISYGITELIEAQAKFNSSRYTISRLHITRATKDEIHVYKDYGKATMVGVGISLEAYLPIISLKITKNKGIAKTKFYKIDISNKTEKELRKKNLLALNDLFKNNDLEFLETFNKPFLIEHSFKTNNADTHILFFRSSGQKTSDMILIKHPEGGEKSIKLNSIAKRTGKDLQAFTIEAINALLEELSDEDISVSNPGGGDPASGYKGSSFTKDIQFVTDTTSKKPYPFGDIEYNWKGWNAREGQIKSTLEQIKDRFGNVIFDELDLIMTENLQLYDINVKVYLYKPAIESLVQLPTKSLIKFIKENSTLENDENNLEMSLKEHFITKISDLHTKLQNSYRDFDHEKSNELATSLTYALDESLKFSDLTQLLGGENNIFLQGVIKGFRDGDEDGDTPIISSTIGQIGSEQISGPLRTLQRQIGISDGEFRALWIMREL